MPERGRVSVVTGGALGIGGAISRRLAASGDVVILNDIDSEAAARTCADIEAAVVAFLASDDARFVTGHTIPVDGGTLAASGWFVRADDRGWTNRPHRA